MKECMVNHRLVACFNIQVQFVSITGTIAREATEETAGVAFDEPDIDDSEGFVTVNQIDAGGDSGEAFEALKENTKW